jgi:hypothetical protein
MSQPVVRIPPNLEKLPAELIGMMGDYLSVPELVRLSLVNKRVRSIVLKILIERLQLDLPSQTPVEQLGLTLKVTILQLREFFKTERQRKRQDLISSIAIPIILGFKPDLRQRKITMDEVLSLRSLELLRLALKQGREYHNNFADFNGDENSFLLNARARAITLGHQRMALEILLYQNDKNYLNYTSKEAQLRYLCAAYGSGEMSLVEYVEARISALSLKHLYENSSAELLSSAHTSDSIEHIVGQLPSSFTLTANLIEHTYTHRSPAVFERILSLGGKTSPAEILKGLYLTKSIPTIEAKGKQLYLQPHPLELYFACLTMNLEIVQYAINKIGASHSEEGKTKASEHLCQNFNLPLIELLIKNGLFVLSTKNTHANLTALFKNANDKTAQLLDLIDSMSPAQNAYIVSSSSYITANEQRLYFACLTRDPQVVQSTINNKKPRRPDEVQHSDAVKAQASAYLCQNCDLPLLELLIKNKLFLLKPEDASSNLEALFKNAKAQNKTAELLHLIDAMEINAHIVNSRFYIQAKYPYYTFFKSLFIRVLIFCANFWNFLRNLVR